MAERAGAVLFGTPQLHSSVYFDSVHSLSVVDDHDPIYEPFTKNEPYKNVRGAGIDAVIYEISDGGLKRVVETDCF